MASSQLCCGIDEDRPSKGARLYLSEIETEFE